MRARLVAAPGVGVSTTLAVSVFIHRAHLRARARVAARKAGAKALADAEAARALAARGGARAA